jgi:hypothetical protein
MVCEGDSLLTKEQHKVTIDWISAYKAHALQRKGKRRNSPDRLKS